MLPHDASCGFAFFLFVQDSALCFLTFHLEKVFLSVCGVSGHVALCSRDCEWLGVVAVVSRLVVKRFPFVPSGLNVCAKPDMLMPAEGRQMLRLRSRLEFNTRHLGPKC